MECKGCDRMCGVFSDARQQTQFFNRARQAAMMLMLHDFRCGVEISGPDVVAESLPDAKNIIFRGVGQDGKIWKSVEPFIVKRQHGRDLRLLEHDFGNEDRVGIARLAPRKITAVLAIPSGERAPEQQTILG